MPQLKLFQKPVTPEQLQFRCSYNTPSGVTGYLEFIDEEENIILCHTPDAWDQVPEDRKFNPLPKKPVVCFWAKYNLEELTTG